MAKMAAKVALSDSTDRFIICGLFPALDTPFYKKDFPRARIAIAQEPLDVLSRWQREYGHCEIVVAYLVHPDLTREFLDSLQLPHTTTIKRAAELLHQLPCHPPMVKLMIKSILDIREPSVSSISEWVDAVRLAGRLKGGLK